MSFLQAQVAGGVCKLVIQGGIMTFNSNIALISNP